MKYLENPHTVAGLSAQQVNVLIMLIINKRKIPYLPIIRFMHFETELPYLLGTTNPGGGDGLVSFWNFVMLLPRKNS